MMRDHDTITVDPTLDALLRDLASQGDLPPERDRRVRERIGLPPPDPNVNRAVSHALVTPASIPQTKRETGEELSMITTSRPSHWRQWIELVAAGIAILLVAAVLVAVFRGSDDSPSSRLGTIASPTAEALDETLTVEEAQERLSFELIVPESLPGALSIAGVFVEEDNRAATIWLADGNSSIPTITIRQTLDRVMTPAAEEMQQALLESLDDPPASPVPTPTQNHVTVADRTMLQTIIHDGTGRPIFLYSWSQGAVYINVDGLDASQDEVEQVVEAIASMATPESTADTATATPARESALPTPDVTGTYRDLTIDQAQQLVPFPLVMPNPIPTGIGEPDIMVSESPPIATGGRIYRVESYFGLTGDETPQQSVLYLQTNRAPTNAPAEESTTLAVNDQQVQKSVTERLDTLPVAVYWWETDDGMYRQVIAQIEGGVTVPLIEELVAAIVSASSPTAADQSTEAQVERLERERAALWPYPVPDACETTAWSGPDFRIRRTGAAAYFIDGDGLNLGTTHGLLYSGENEVTWTATTPLTTDEALNGPRMITATRLDEPGEQVEIPTAVTSQIDQRVIADDAIERAWTSVVNVPEEGCWEIRVELGVHTLDAVVYVYDGETSATSVASAQGDWAVHPIITVERAREIVPCPLAFPMSLDEPFGEQGIRVFQEEPLPSGEPVYRGEMLVEVTRDDPDDRAIKYIQSNRALSVLPERGSETVEIGGRDVFKAVTTTLVDRPWQILYWWETDGIYDRVFAELDGDVTESIADQFVASILNRL